MTAKQHILFLCVIWASLLPVVAEGVGQNLLSVAVLAFAVILFLREPSGKSTSNLEHYNLGVSEGRKLAMREKIDLMNGAGAVPIPKPREEAGLTAFQMSLTQALDKLKNFPPNGEVVGEVKFRQGKAMTIPPLPDSILADIRTLKMMATPFALNNALDKLQRKMGVEYVVENMKDSAFRERVSKHSKTCKRKDCVVNEGAQVYKNSIAKKKKSK